MKPFPALPDVLPPHSGIPSAPAELGPDYPIPLARAGSGACHAAHEFFHARISNPHTRRAYGRAVRAFLSWCEAEDLELVRVTPGLAGQYFHALAGSAAFEVSGPIPADPRKKDARRRPVLADLGMA